MFINNKYTKIYYQLIDKRKKIPLLKEDFYCEKHHIIPKSLGGNDNADNLINLLPREHFIAHLLLTKMVDDKQSIIKMSWALHRMWYKHLPINSRGYEFYRNRHIKFLKEHHHSKRIINWNQKMSDMVYETWKNNEERRKQTSINIKKWIKENPKEFYERQKKASKIGAQASKLIVAKRIKYNDKTYIGWKELFDATGISKHLYKKYYLKGIDPIFRIGKDGPMKYDDITELINWFCDKQNIKINIKEEKEIDFILEKMYNVGLLSTKEKETYIKKRKESR